MKLASLLGHSAEIIKIIRKSHQPSDMILTDYFRKKKYIGSSERRFLSELVFLVLRGYGLFDYCLYEAINNKNNDISPVFLRNEIMISAVTIFIFEKHTSYNSIFHPSELAKKFTNNENDNFIEQLIESIIEKIECEKNIIEKFFLNIEAAFDELEKKAIFIKSKLTDINSEELEIISHRYSLPSWIIDTLYNNKTKNFNINEISNLAESLLEPAPLTIRVNLSQISRKDVLEFFKNNSIDCEACELSPSGIIIKKRTQLNSLEIFKKGLIEVQDEGSQLISYALSPNENERILDACAGAGGKSIHIADLMNNTGEIISNDVDIRKLKILLARAHRCGFDKITIKDLTNIQKTSASIKRSNFDFIFDKVLVDAPCSGMGTVRRMPMQKWRLTPELLKKHSIQQLKILEHYSQFVIDGGVLVYSTCSLMAEENEEIVDRFLVQNQQFKPYPLKPDFNKHHISIDGLKEDDFMIRFSPDKHGCDGFFISKFIKED
ncbi:MAG: RsmB/NOP family class I SAM-dependent RNA methyltransferase [Ignavibacteriae bacterium]|nr:RsmB/NOP family class I SAM-dependent RNA methyltransferase [Ignavibacteriota bacterium]